MVARETAEQRLAASQDREQGNHQLGLYLREKSRLFKDMPKPKGFFRKRCPDCDAPMGKKRTIWNAEDGHGFLQRCSDQCGYEYGRWEKVSPDRSYFGV